MVAPTPVSGLLHAVAVVKVGVFSIVRIMFDIIGIGEDGFYDGHVSIYGMNPQPLAAQAFAKEFLPVPLEIGRTKIEYNPVGTDEFCKIFHCATTILKP